MTKKSNYTLKAGVLLQMPSDPNVYTNANLTDEIAERYLKDNVNRANLFQAMPEDWEGRINAKKTKQKNESSKKSESTPEEKIIDASHPDIIS